MMKQFYKVLKIDLSIVLHLYFELDDYDYYDL